MPNPSKPYKPNPYKTDPYKTDPYKPKPYKTDPYKTDPYKAWRGASRDDLSDSEEEYVDKEVAKLKKKIKKGRRHAGDITRGLDINCSYFEKCKDYVKKTLRISGQYLEPIFNCCYCPRCCGVRKDGVYFSSGSPATIYGTPIGWSRFALSVGADKNNIWDRWNVAYHGTTVGAIPDILRVGYLIIPGDVRLDGKRHGVRPLHFEESEKTRMVFVSPSIRYVEHGAYTPPDRNNVKVALQLRVKPGTFEVRRETVLPATHRQRQIDPLFSNEQLEWCTNRRGSVFLTGLLVKFC